MLWIRWLVGLHLGPAADRAMTEMGQTQQTWANRAKCKLEAKLGPPEPLAILTTAMQSYDTIHEQYNYFAIMLAFLLKLSFRKTFRTPLHFPSTFWPIAGRNDWRIIDRNGFSFVCKTTRTAVEVQFEIGQIFYIFHQTINFTAFSLTSTTRLKILQLLDVAAIYLLWMLSPL